MIEYGGIIKGAWWMIDLSQYHPKAKFSLVNKIVQYKNGELTSAFQSGQ